MHRPVSDHLMDKFLTDTIDRLKTLHKGKYEDLWIPVPCDVCHAMTAYYIRWIFLYESLQGDDEKIILDDKLMVLFERLKGGMTDLARIIKSEQEDHRQRITGSSGIPTQVRSGKGSYSSFDVVLFFPMSVNLSDMTKCVTGHFPEHISTNANHWVLCCVDVIENELVVLDSIAHKETSNVLSGVFDVILGSDMFKNVLGSLVDNALKTSYTVQKSVKSVQETPNLCGYYVMYYASMIMRSEIVLTEVPMDPEGRHNEDTRGIIKPMFSDETVISNFMPFIRREIRDDVS